VQLDCDIVLVEAGHVDVDVIGLVAFAHVGLHHVAGRGRAAHARRQLAPLREEGIVEEIREHRVIHQ
jgi:hypothetical protein